MQCTRSLTQALKGPASGADDRTGSDPERSGTERSGAMRRAARLPGVFAFAATSDRACLCGSSALLYMQLLPQHSPLHSRVTVKQTRPSAKTQVSLDVFIQWKFGQTTLNRSYSESEIVSRRPISRNIIDSIHLYLSFQLTPRINQNRLAVCPSLLYTSMFPSCLWNFEMDNGHFFDKIILKIFFLHNAVILNSLVLIKFDYRKNSKT